MSKDKLKFYGDGRSGNYYKLQLLCSEMNVSYDWVEVDILAGDTRTPEFLSKNPNGRIPLLELPDGRHLAESNAILCFLADGSEFFGNDAWERAEVLQWMFFEQYSHEPFIATNRFWRHLLREPEKHADAIAANEPKGYAALGVMEQHLSEHSFFVDEQYSIADISLFAYTHVAHEGGFDLSGYPNVVAWIDRVQAQPRHIPIEA